MKAKIYDAVKTLVDIKSDISQRIIPRGTEGTIIEAYESPVEGYAVDIAIPDETQISGFRYDNVILYPNQFIVLDEKGEKKAPGFGRG